LVCLKIKKKKLCQTAITTCRGLSNLIGSLCRIVCRGQGAFKAVKGLRGQISRPILDL
jgi:hypothetical protein